VYGIVTQAGGRIIVDSTPDVGTTFDIAIPMMAGKTAGDSTPAGDSEVPHGSGIILLVEDEEQVRRYTSLLLKRLGYQVVDAADAATALQMCDQMEKIDLLMTDTILPDQSGRRVAEQVTARRPEVKVLYTSGYTEDDILRHGVMTNEVHFLQKPFRAETLARKIHEILVG
jgi:two-component system, cell cycle sensor histidine kinase and response regulator CckA